MSKVIFWGCVHMCCCRICSVEEFLCLSGFRCLRIRCFPAQQKALQPRCHRTRRRLHHFVGSWMSRQRYVNCLERVLCLQCSRELLRHRKYACQKAEKLWGLQPDRVPRWHVRGQCCGLTWVNLEQLVKLQSSSELRLLLMFLTSIALDIYFKCWVERLWCGPGFRVS